MSNTKVSDKAAFEQLVRSGRRTNRVNWTPVPGQDDRDALNDALRKAGGHDPQHEGQEPGTFPWTSMSPIDEK